MAYVTAELKKKLPRENYANFILFLVTSKFRKSL
jgi:hypothetical protein